MSRSHDDRSPRRDQGTSWEDFTTARMAFLETLRRDSEFRRVAAAWHLDSTEGDAGQRIADPTEPGGG